MSSLEPVLFVYEVGVSVWGWEGRMSSPFEPDASSHAERITHYTTPPHTTQLATMQAHHVIKPPTPADIPKAHELEVLSYPEVSKCLICVYGVQYVPISSIRLATLTKPHAVYHQSVLPASLRRDRKGSGGAIHVLLLLKTAHCPAQS